MTASIHESNWGQWLSLVYTKTVKRLENQAVSHAELKLEGIAVFANDIFLTFFFFLKTIEHEHMTLYTNCNALLYPIIYESVHLCTLPVQLLS